MEWTADEVLRVQKLIYELDTQSLNQKIKGDEDDYGDTELGDFVESPESLEDSFDKKELTRLLLKCIDKLNPREQLVIKLRFGLIDGEPKSLEKVGEYFGVTRERIRQVEARSLKKLKTIISKTNMFEDLI